MASHTVVVGKDFLRFLATYFMGRMAVYARGKLVYLLLPEFLINYFQMDFFDSAMAALTGVGDIASVNFRGWVFMGKHIVVTVAIVTDCSYCQTSLEDALTMDGHGVGFNNFAFVDMVTVCQSFAL